MAGSAAQAALQMSMTPAPGPLEAPPALSGPIWPETWSLGPTLTLGPLPGSSISQVGVIPPPTAALPPDQNLAGWYSMLQDGAEVPVFDWVTLIHTPVNATDATNKLYVDTAVALGVPPANPLVLNVALVLNSTLTANGAVTLNGPVTINGALVMPNLPKDNLGLTPGQLWNNAGVVSVA